jgi:hypothetical protein
MLALSWQKDVGIGTNHPLLGSAGPEPRSALADFTGNGAEK